MADEKGIPLFDLLVNNLGKKKEIDKNTKELQILLQRIDEKIKYNDENNISNDKLLAYRDKVNSSLNVSVADDIGHNMAQYVKIQLISTTKLSDENKDWLPKCRAELLSEVNEVTKKELLKRIQKIDKSH